MTQSSLSGLDDCLTDPVFWLGIAGPAIILVVVSVYFLPGGLQSKVGQVRKKISIQTKPEEQKTLGIGRASPAHASREENRISPSPIS